MVKDKEDNIFSKGWESDFTSVEGLLDTISKAVKGKHVKQKRQSKIMKTKPTIGLDDLDRAIQGALTGRGFKQ